MPTICERLFPPTSPLHTTDEGTSNAILTLLAKRILTGQETAADFRAMEVIDTLLYYVHDYCVELECWDDESDGEYDAHREYFPRDDEIADLVEQFEPAFNLFELDTEDPLVSLRPLMKERGMHPGIVLRWLDRLARA